MANRQQRTMPQYQSMSQLLKNQYVPNLNRFLESFKQIRKRYAILNQKLFESKDEVERQCKLGNISTQATNQVFKHFNGLATRIDGKSSASEALNKKISELENLSDMFSFESGKLRLDMCLQFDRTKNQFENKKIEKCLDICMFGSNELAELTRQERYVKEFQADLQIVKSKALVFVQKLVQLRHQESRHLDVLMRSLGGGEVISQSCISQIQYQPRPNIQVHPPQFGSLPNQAFQPSVQQQQQEIAPRQTPQVSRGGIRMKSPIAPRGNTGGRAKSPTAIVAQAVPQDDQTNPNRQPIRIKNKQTVNQRE